MAKATTVNRLTQELRAAYADVRRDFFPRWDRQRLWRFRVGGAPGRCQSQCDTKLRLIRINVLHPEPDERDLLLIHEICHALACVAHWRPWFRRMRKAADRAEAFGRAHLADMIRQHVREYEETPVQTAAEIYD
jgi:hypothetical protein